MPRLPVPEDYQLKPPHSLRDVTDISPVQVRPDLATGKVLSDLGQMIEQETAKVDDVVTQDALNKLKEKRAELTYGDSGFTKLKSGDAVKTPMVTTFGDRLNAEMESLSAGLNSPRAKLKFQQHAAQEMTGYKTDVMRHQATELEHFSQATFAGTMTNIGDATVRGASATAAEAAVNPGGLAEQPALLATRQAANDAIQAEVARRGLSGPAADMFRQIEFGKITDNVVKQLMTDNRSPQAMEYLKTAYDKGEIAQNQYEQFSKEVKRKASWEQGSELAAQATEKLKAGEKKTDIEEWLRKETKGNEDAYNSAQKVWTQFQQAQTQQEHADVGAYLGPFYAKPTSANRNAIEQQMLNARVPPTVSGRVLQAMDAEIRTLVHYGKFLQNESYSSPEVLQKVTDTMNRADFASIPQPVLWGMGREIGGQHARLLASAQHEMITQGRRFQIDSKVVTGFLPPELRGPGMENKAETAAFRSLVDIATEDWKARPENKGKIPDERQQREIMRGATQEYAVNRPGWFLGWKSDDKVKAYELRPVPVDFEDKLQAGARAKGLPPLSRARIQEAWAAQGKSKLNESQ